MMAVTMCASSVGKKNDFKFQCGPLPAALAFECLRFKISNALSRLHKNTFFCASGARCYFDHTTYGVPSSVKPFSKLLVFAGPAQFSRNVLLRVSSKRPKDLTRFFRLYPSWEAQLMAKTMQLCKDRRSKQPRLISLRLLCVVPGSDQASWIL